jgi:membrane protein involved in colicin uptake
MRLWGLTLLTLGLIVLVSEPVSAQQRQRGGFGGGGSSAFLLMNSGVQKELKLSDEQLEKAKKFGEEMRTKMGEQFRGLQDLQGEERTKKREELTKKLAEESEKALKDILKPEQIKRLHQISLQQRGMNAFTDEKVQTALKLSDEQKGKLKELADETRKAQGEIRQSAQGNREEAAKKSAELRKSSMDKALGVLSDDQKKSWKDLTGEAFEVKFERPAGVGGNTGEPRRRPRGEQKPKEKKSTF